FLATDNADIEKRFIDEVGGNLITNSKEFPEFNKDKGIHYWAINDDSKTHLLRKIFEESIDDLWMLSMCDQLFYQGNSTFSQLAALLSKGVCLDWQKFE
ncbi:MAG: hypothetical protein HRT72_11755, partial [Flavobacteriales bacterium]|nr:hypothetical protein [Flavobacteriales bacterium]